MNRFLSLALSLLAGIGAFAAIPDGYYNRLNGKTGSELKQAAHDVINPHTTISSYSNLPQYFQKTDVYPRSTRWWDMYSNVVRYAPTFSGLNREHSFPKSWWGGSTATPAYIDLFHLYPADGPANMAKSNYPLGEVAQTAVSGGLDNGLTLVGYPVAGQGGGASLVFEPGDEYKGDFARTYFYFVTCYTDLTWASKYSWMLQQNAYPTLTPWAVDLLLKWARQDPVSEKEVERNDMVYSYQNNRNPFIDFPDLCEYIWGNKMGEKFVVSSGTTSGEAILTAPVAGTTLDFGQVAVGSTTKALLFFKGEGLSSNLSLSLGGEDRGMFALDTRSINPQLVNNSTGYYLQVSYTPTALGEHNARILIYDGGLPGTGIYVYFHGEALSVPTLNKLTAYEADVLGSDTYVASWSPATEVIDSYILTRNRSVGGNILTEELELDGETPSVTLDGFADSESESYSVQSSRLGYRSPASNVVFVSHSGLSDINAEYPLKASSRQGAIRIQVTAPHTDARIYDTAGQLVMLIPLIESSMEITTLPAGVYILVTNEHPSPVKIIAL